LEQPQYKTIPVPEQIAVLLSTTEGVFDDIPVDKVKDMEQKIRDAVRDNFPEITRQILKGKSLDKNVRSALLESAQKAVSE